MKNCPATVPLAPDSSSRTVRMIPVSLIVRDGPPLPLSSDSAPPVPPTDPSVPRAPVSVRRSGDVYVLVSGEEQLRAAELLHLSSVPCVVDGDASPPPVPSRRSGLNMFEEAEAIKSLVGGAGMTQEKVAKRLSCSQSYVANKLRLLRFSDEERQLILSSSLSERHARAALRLSDRKRRIDALHEMIRKRMNVASAEEYVEALLCSGDPLPVSPPEENSGSTGTGKFEIEFKRRLLLRDMRIFYNSIDHAVSSVRACGFDVVSTRTRTRDGVEISIVVKNCEKQ